MRLAGRALLIVSLKYFSIMQKSYYQVFIELPSGVITSRSLAAQSWFHAVELLFYRDGWHRVQPDRSKYFATR